MMVNCPTEILTAHCMKIPIPTKYESGIPTLLQHTFTRFQSGIFQPFLPAGFFIAGVTYDSLTLSRIDHLTDNLLFLLYLSLLGTLVIITGRFQLGLIPDHSETHRWNALAILHHTRPHLSKALQFLFGGLFSAYAILYSQSVSIMTSAIFLGIILGFLIANEFLQDRYSNLKILVGLFAIVLLSFLTFFLPVLTGWMNASLFLCGAILTGGIVWKMVHLILRGPAPVQPHAHFRLCLPAFLVIGFCIGLYFLNWIPPIPLSLKFGGIYHSVEKTEDRYALSYQKGQWFEWGKQSDDRLPTHQPVFCFSSVFAPVTLDTTIYHHWQWKPEEKASTFTTTDRIPISITGGREHGYRFYTKKQSVQPGEWRVDVETEDGRIIGRMTFLAEDDASETEEFITITR